MRTLFVSGASGGIGSRVIFNVSHQYEIRALSRQPKSSTSSIVWTRGDLADQAQVAEALGSADMIAACHGADGSLPPNDFEQTDYMGTVNLIDAAIAVGHFPLFVYISSIYTSRANPPEVEPGNPFLWKRRAEAYLRASGLPYVIIRPSWLRNGPGGHVLRSDQGDNDDGWVDREDVARIIAASFESEESWCKTFEVYSNEAYSEPTFSEVFTNLHRD